MPVSNQEPARIAEGTGDMIAEINGIGAVFYLSNHRGDTMAAYCNLPYDPPLIAKYRYDAFGNQRSSYCVVNDTTHAPRFTFSTKEYLSDAELYLYAYRVYDPIAGRWTQRDPIDYQDSINLYQFCGNNPVNGTDADGRMLTLGIATACGTIGGFLTGAGISVWKTGSFKGALKQGAKGALIGFAAGITIDSGGTALAVMGICAAAGVAGEAIDQGTQGKLGTTEGQLRVLGAGAGAGIGGYAGGLVVNPIASAIVSSVVGEAGAIAGGEGGAEAVKRVKEIEAKRTKAINDVKENIHD